MPLCTRFAFGVKVFSSPLDTPSVDLLGFLGCFLCLGTLPHTPTTLASLDPQLHLLSLGTLLGLS